MYDLIILGAGPGGYVAAERAAAGGLKTLLIEKDRLGGVCLNAGCIPTKTLLSAAKTYAHALEAESIGVTVKEAVFHLDKAMAWKARVIETLQKGIAAMLKRGGVEVVQGEGRLVKPGTVRVDRTDYQAKSVIIATGSSSVVPPIPGVKHPKVVTSTELLNIAEMPKKLVIVGGGIIGMEFASFFSMLSAEVTVVEMMDEIIPALDREFALALRKALPKVSFELGAKVQEFSDAGVGYSRGGQKNLIPADLALLCIGRRPNTGGMGFEEAGLEITKTGVKTDECMRTNLPGVYAVGDVTGRSLLAHSASRMGEIAVNTILGKKDRWRGNAIPWVVFSTPEVAGCGMTEAEALAKGYEVVTAKVPMRLSGRYLAEHPGENGVCKVVAEKSGGVILGVNMLGTGCSEIIAGAALMIESELRVQDVKEIVFPHPTVSEVMREALFEIK
ncbi:MAG: dihydrolipoyl dehydrogenase [Spirochaetales bacterium]|jgi:dihydrolipoamide dehydrogenase|nr:dihydrolipoyl dehydrogenase [Spirochaetales bacterium]